MLDAAPAALRLAPGECELLYGRSGYLYALLFLRKHLGPAAVDQDLVTNTLRSRMPANTRKALCVAAEGRFLMHADV